MAAIRRPNFLARREGFTILELLVSFVVLAVLLVLLTTMIGRTSSIWAYTRSQAEQFREARDAFDTLTRKLAEATLNTYFDYEDAGGEPRSTANSTSFVPKSYGRQSELRFLSGPELQGISHAVFFQSPLGNSDNGSGTSGSKLLNTVGFYVEHGDDSRFLPSFLPSKQRTRLMQFCEPAETLSIYKYTSGNATEADRKSRNWFTKPLSAANPPEQIIADNIVALILLPQIPATERQGGSYDETSLAPDYLYDSTVRKSDPNINPRHQLPPTIQVTMVAIDEHSAARLGEDGFASLKSAVSSRFRKASEYQTDLAGLESELQALGVNFKVFTSSVILKNAKWSRDQKG